MVWHGRCQTFRGQYLRCSREIARDRLLHWVMLGRAVHFLLNAQDEEFAAAVLLCQALGLGRYLPVIGVEKRRVTTVFRPDAERRLFFLLVANHGSILIPARMAISVPSGTMNTSR